MNVLVLDDVYGSVEELEHVLASVDPEAAELLVLRDLKIPDIWIGYVNHKGTWIQLAEGATLQDVEDDADLMDHPDFIEAAVSRHDLSKMLKKKPHPFEAPAHGGSHRVIVHKSTRTRGWWQASFFYKGEAISDIDASTWDGLLEELQFYGVNWKSVESDVRKYKANGRVVIRPKGWDAIGDEGIEALHSWRRNGHVYRGMTSEEFDATVGQGFPVQSTGAHSFEFEGTSFADDPEEAESYVNFGRDNPRKTGNPTYLVEVGCVDSMKRWRDGYIKTPEPVDAVRIWKMFARDGDIVADRVK